MKLDRKKCMVVLSGGMDSATLLCHMMLDGYGCRALSVDYAQRHHRELDCARALTDEVEVPHTIVRLPELADVLSGCSLTDDVPVPHGNYTEEAMKATVVPNRNMVLLSIAAGAAISEGCGTLAYGAHAGDHSIYPDCRPEFVAKMQAVFYVCHYEPLILEVPFLGMDKGDICKLGLEMGVSYDMTHTCYEGDRTACGKCGACRERLEAFKKAGVEDPIPYAKGVR